MCSSELSFTDLDTQEIITLGAADLTIAENNITFTSELLTVNRHYNVSVSVKNIVESTSTKFSEFSKFIGYTPAGPYLRGGGHSSPPSFVYTPNSLPPQNFCIQDFIQKLGFPIPISSQDIVRPNFNNKKICGPNPTFH